MKTLVSTLLLVAAVPAFAQQQRYSLPSILSFTYPNNLVVARSGARIAWVILQRGERSIWVADGPQFQPKRLASYPDDGQETGRAGRMAPPLLGCDERWTAIALDSR